MTRRKLDFIKQKTKQNFPALFWFFELLIHFAQNMKKAKHAPTPKRLNVLFEDSQEKQEESESEQNEKVEQTTEVVLKIVVLMEHI